MGYRWLMPMGREDGAASEAADRVRAVRDSVEERYSLAIEFYRDRMRYGRGELSFLRWAIDRGVLNPPIGAARGSPWWRAVNDRLLCHKVEADLLHNGARGHPSCRGVELWLQFIRAPSALSWYRAHNSSIVVGYLDNEALAEAELPTECFMVNVALVRVLYAHALVADARLALGFFGPLGRLLGDPRRGTVRFSSTCVGCSRWSIRWTGSALMSLWRLRDRSHALSTTASLRQSSPTCTGSRPPHWASRGSKGFSTRECRRMRGPGGGGRTGR